MNVTTLLAALILVIDPVRSLASGQPSAGDPSSRFHGGWILNREDSMTPAGPDGRGERGPGRGTGPGGAGPGRGMGRPGGGPGRRGGGGRGGGDRSPEDREEMERRRALIEDVLRPASRWVITPGDGGLIVFTDADGRSARFLANDRQEKHQRPSGTIETRTKWVGTELHQEIVLGKGLKAERTYSVDEGDRLVVSTRLQPGGPGGRRPPVRWVYDREVE